MKACITLLLALTILLVGCGSNASSDEISAVDWPDNTTVLSSPEMMQALLDFNEPVLVYFGRPTCPDCAKFEPILAEIMKEQTISLYYYNTDERRKDDSFQAIIDTFGIEQVPSLQIIRGEESLYRYEYDAENPSIAVEQVTALCQVIQKHQDDAIAENSVATFPDGSPICPSCAA